MKPLHQVIKNISSFRVFFLLLAFVLCFPATAEQEHQIIRSRYYQLEAGFISDISESDLKLLDTRIEYYNDFLQLQDPEQIAEGGFSLRLFMSADNINTYMTEKGLDKQDKNIFMLITDTERAEIVFTPEVFNSDEFNRYCFMQYFKSSISSPPPWLSTGFIYFFDFYFDIESDKNFIPDLREYISGISVSEFAGAVNEIFYISDNMEMDKTDRQIAWAVIDYIHSDDSPDRYKRFLWDSIKVLDRDKSAEENIIRIADNVLKWINTDIFADNLRTYILNTVTLADLFNKGLEIYREGDYDSSAEIFEAASNYDTRAFYYAGLCHYSAGRYAEASQWFNNALESGFRAGAVLYALGINALAVKDYTGARNYFNKVIDNYPGQYAELAEEMAGRIK